MLLVPMNSVARLRAALSALFRPGLAILIGLLLPLARSHASAPPPVARGAQFATDLLPLLQAKCLRCHGGKARKADLDLRTPASIRKGAQSGRVIVPGKPHDSLLFVNVRDGVMPPGKKHRLSAAEVAAVGRWIESEASAAAVTQLDVIPILLRRCTVCHGPRKQEGGLDLRTRVGLLRGGKSGPAVVLGKPEQSLLIKKVRAGQMPPLRRIIEVSVKPMEPEEVSLLARWIAAGAPEAVETPDVATTRADPLVGDKDRTFWAFRPPRPVPVPRVHEPGKTRNPIDAFVLSRLENKELSFSPEADRATLLRRVYLDLTGLPPRPAEARAFLADRDPAAYEKVVDRLLASPRYGERWARHWLDLAGYADSEGKREQDLARPNAWRYRDYVIRALNAGKAYDRFLLEQLAGDELHDHERAREVTQEIYDSLVATGFLRMAPDPTWFNLTNFVPDRLEVIADEIEVLSSSVLGLTMKCARCHDHKFDPIPQRDYYRLKAVFQGAFDEHDWMKPNWLPGLSMGARTDRDLPVVTTAERRRWEAHNAGLHKQIASLRARKIDPTHRKQAEERDRQIRALEARLLPEPKIRALWDRGEPSPSVIYRRGDYLTPGRLVGPGVPSVLTDGKTPFMVKPPWPGAKKTGRRLSFARWLIRPDHPLTARVKVNRLWKHHFGAGIVKTLDNFGRNGARPTHPELLDWLALEFVKSGWDLKTMHRLMVTSATYRQGSGITPTLHKLDPDNALCSRMPLQRLSAEQLYDAMVRAAGRLDATPFGPPDALHTRPDGLVTPAGTAAGWRRGIYLQQQRKVIATHLENFDFPQMNPNCVERRDSIAAPQALYLKNNAMVRQLAADFACRVRREAGAEPVKQVERVHIIAYSRPPGVEERRSGLAALARLREQWARLRAPGAAGADERALASYCHAVFNSAEFLYVD
jgi:mono/diheme cytochrome c family protein